MATSHDTAVPLTFPLNQQYYISYFQTYLDATWIIIMGPVIFTEPSSLNEGI